MFKTVITAAVASVSYALSLSSQTQMSTEVQGGYGDRQYGSKNNCYNKGEWQWLCDLWVYAPCSNTWSNDYCRDYALTLWTGGLCENQSIMSKVTMTEENAEWVKSSCEKYGILCIEGVTCPKK